MKIAFDIDGTLTMYPEQLKKLMNESSIILTGSLDKNLTVGVIEEHSTNPNRIAQLENYGIELIKHGQLVRCIGRDVVEVAKLKGKYCLDNNIDLIFEDSPLFTYWIRRISPNTACFLTHEDKYC